MPSFNAPVEEAFDAPDAREVPDALVAKRVLVSLDFHKVLDLHFGDSRDFLRQIGEQCPDHLRLDPIVVSYSGVERGRQTRATMRRELPGVPVVITTGAVGKHGKGAALADLARERSADCVCHIDDC